VQKAQLQHISKLISALQLGWFILAVKAARLVHCRKLTLAQTAQLPSVQTDRLVHGSKHIGWLLYLMKIWLVRCSKLIFAQRLDGCFIFWKQLGGDTEINSFQQRQID
jgi:hypothetical protein